MLEDITNAHEEDKGGNWILGKIITTHGILACVYNKTLSFTSNDLYWK